MCHVTLGERERERETVYQALDTSISCLLCERD